MVEIELSPEEVKVVLFALRSDLETVENNIEEFPGEDETIMTIIAKIEEKLRVANRIDGRK